MIRWRLRLITLHQATRNRLPADPAFVQTAFAQNHRAVPALSPGEVVQFLSR